MIYMHPSFLRKAVLRRARPHDTEQGMDFPTLAGDDQETALVVDNVCTRGVEPNRDQGNQKFRRHTQRDVSKGT